MECRRTTSFPPPPQQGYTLIEAMVAVLVLAIGLLGLAGLQATAIRFNHDAQLRSQATFLAYDITERMRANLTGAYESGFSGNPNCDTDFTPSGTAPASDDLEEWRNLLACLLPRGDGAIIRAGDTVTVHIQWNEREDQNADFLQQFEFSTRLF
ncbi:type IV pilus modification protein PilV [Ectothiorhodospira lacustris]|uniref:type IV pilus modification protein PilV n=1 Tax=Ectothiorhodospira lacustris TaxID=2899127 RepID=UPI001EE80416|nr:type IV pilus modification protein PilV [Ectothiorhodospira lacustris]MCG5501792.1 type IV pilus modification protein PilV [Ectothiorhodospira lacustris]MCG5509825.1 type IV pilus modification protein PilV [Ectothiorhodospira lacustris]MCG5521078.1 type IV pilus modification protein PilV [Ectothiorhodospira lacustris]